MDSAEIMVLKIQLLVWIKISKRSLRFTRFLAKICLCSDDWIAARNLA